MADKENTSENIKKNMENSVENEEKIRVPVEENGDGNNLIQTVKTDNRKNENTQKYAKSSKPRKKMKKGIFVSYSPDAGYFERKFVVETVRQFKENNLAEDIWFDRDENNTDSPCWFSLRMEAVEKCRAAIMILSESYFACPVSVYEGKALLERKSNDAHSVKLFPVLYSWREGQEMPKIYSPLVPKMVDISNGVHGQKSLAEKTSVVVGALMVDLERCASVNMPPKPINPQDTEFTQEFKTKKISQWEVTDLQEWLFTLGIKEFYRQSLAENMVDGFLLMSMTDQDMSQHLGIDSRVVKKKIMQQILATLDKEHKLEDNWHLRARTQRSKPNCLYLVYDPADVRLAQSLKTDLTKKGLQVIHHQQLGQSKDEFLKLNGPQMAAATFLLIVMTENSINSPFVFHEVLFGDWLGKKIVISMFKNTWASLRPSLKAVLGECPAVDFESQMYSESMDILEHHIKPLRMVPGVVLEQSYLNKMTEGLKPFALLGNVKVSEWNGEEEPKVFISFQWDAQSRIDDIRKMLEEAKIPSWTDIKATMAGSSNKTVHGEPGRESLQIHIQRNMKSSLVVLCCVTPKYLQSDNCIKDLTLAETLQKPVIPVMLSFCPWPPEGAPQAVRKILVKHRPVDMSNDKLFQQNSLVLLEKIKRIVASV